MKADLAVAVSPGAEQAGRDWADWAGWAGWAGCAGCAGWLGSGAQAGFETDLLLRGGTSSWSLNAQLRCWDEPMVGGTCTSLVCQPLWASPVILRAGAMAASCMNLPGRDLA